MLQEFTFSDRVMGSDFIFSAVCDDETVATTAFAHALAICVHYEQVFSRFISESELSILNVEKEIAASTLLVETLSKAITLSEMTNGAYNPLVQIARHGYTATFDSIKVTQQRRDHVEYSTDLSKVIIDKSSGSVTIGEDQALDFGGFLKGHVGSLIADELTHLHGVIINVGGDVTTRGRDKSDVAFEFQLHNPISEADLLAFDLTDMTLATSGTHKRVWDTPKGARHHILDPTRDENPMTDLISVSIIHHDGGFADAFATAAFSLPKSTFSELLEKHRAQYVITYRNGTSNTNIKDIIT